MLLHWYARPDLDEVRLAGKRFEAPRRLREALRQARQLQPRIDRLLAERDQHLQDSDRHRQVLVDAGLPVPEEEQ